MRSPPFPIPVHMNGRKRAPPARSPLQLGLFVTEVTDQVAPARPPAPQRPRTPEVEGPVFDAEARYLTRERAINAAAILRADAERSAREAKATSARAQTERARAAAAQADEAMAREAAMAEARAAALAATAKQRASNARRAAEREQTRAARTSSLSGQLAQDETPTLADEVETFAAFVANDYTRFARERSRTDNERQRVFRYTVRPGTQFYTVTFSAAGSYATVTMRVNKANRQVWVDSAPVYQPFYLNTGRTQGTSKDHDPPSLDNYASFAWGAAYPSAWPVVASPRPWPPMLRSPLRDDELKRAEKAEKLLRAKGTPEERAQDRAIRTLKRAHAFDGEWVPRPMPDPVWVGNAFRSLSPSQIAPLVRQKIQDAVRDGYLPPGLVVAINASGSRLSLTVEDLGVMVVSGDSVRDVLSGSAVPEGRLRDSMWGAVRNSRLLLNAAGETVLSNLDKIAGQYRYDESDAMSDFFVYNFVYVGSAFAPWIIEQQAQELVPAYAPTAPKVSVDYRLTMGLRMVLPRPEALWAYSDGGRMFVGYGRSLSVLRSPATYGGGTTSLLETPAYPLHPVAELDDPTSVAEAYELARALPMPPSRRS